MINSQRVAVIMPAYNAEATLARTVAELDQTIVDELVLVDDASKDETVALARELGLDPIRHETNKGYGGNQKTCYRQAIDLGADIIVMVHPDYQYSPKLVPAMAAMIAYGEYDMVLGSRILAQSSVKRGMPVYKYVSNRFLTFAENVMLSQKLSEYHTGLRAFSSDLLASLPIERNSDDFVFDNQIIAQAIIAGARIGELSCPTRYMDEASSINLRRSVKYGFGVLKTSGDYWLHKRGLRRCDYLDFTPQDAPGKPGRADSPTPDEAGASAESPSPDAAVPQPLPGRSSVRLWRMVRATNSVEPPKAERRPHLTIASIGLLLFAVLSAATGQLLLKHGMQVATARAHATGGSLVVQAATSPVIIGGLAVFAISAVAWLAALAKVPLSVAYPFNALSYLIILTASALLLHERTNLLTWVGSLVVVTGLLIVVFSQKS